MADGLRFGIMPAPLTAPYDAVLARSPDVAAVLARLRGA